MIAWLTLLGPILVWNQARKKWGKNTLTWIDFEHISHHSAFRSRVVWFKTYSFHQDRLANVEPFYSKHTPCTNHHSDKHCSYVVACDHAKWSICQLGERHASFVKIKIQWQCDQKGLCRFRFISSLLVCSRCSIWHLFNWRLTLFLCHTNQK